MSHKLSGRMLAALAVLTGLAAFAYSLSLLGAGSAVPAAGELQIAPRVGALAPEFTLSNLQAQPIRLASLRGRPVLINFWATWCEPCKLEMPLIQQRYQRHRDRGLAVLAVDFDEPAEAVAAFRDELGLTFELLLDPGGRIQRLYQVRGYPSSFFIDEGGVIRAQRIGVMSEGQLDEHLAQIGLTDWPGMGAGGIAPNPLGR